MISLFHSAFLSAVIIISQNSSKSMDPDLSSSDPSSSSSSRIPSSSSSSRGANSTSLHTEAFTYMLLLPPASPVSPAADQATRPAHNLLLCAKLFFSSDPENLPCFCPAICLLGRSDRQSNNPNALQNQLLQRSYNIWIRRSEHLKGGGPKRSLLVVFY